MKKDSQEIVRQYMTACVKKLQDTSQTMEDLYNAIITRDPQADCYTYFDENGRPKTRSYEDFANSVFTTASKLSRIFSSIAPGTIVGLKLKNSPRWTMIFWAILMTGHIPLLIDARLAVENTNNLLKQADAKALIANDEAKFIVPSYRVNEIMNQSADYGFQPEWANNAVFCSSGTTGDAKMMIYSGQNFCAQAIASLNIPERTQDLMYPGPIRQMVMLPYHHVFGFFATYLWFAFYGKCHVYPSSMATSDLLYACQKGKCTHVFSVPMFWDGVALAVDRMVAVMKPGKRDLYAKLLAYNTHKISKKEAGLASNKVVVRSFQKRTLGKHIRYCISGGGFLSPKTQTTINGLGFPLYNGFGMTEIGITSVEQSPKVEQRLKCSIGRPFYQVEYKIANFRGKHGDEGELWVKSPMIHVEEIIGGVRKKTELDADGFFPTGDIAFCDPQGNYYIKGRIKDTIILSNGENVFPDEIEYYFKGVKNVTNLVCLGAKHPGDAEEKITLVCEVDNSAGPEEIEKIYADIKAINAGLPSEKKIQAILIDKRPLPVSGSMKIKRFMIKKSIEEGSKDFYNAESPEKEVVTFEGFDDELVAETIERVTGVFSKVLSLPAYKIEPEAIWNVDLGGDSMSYIEMCQRLNDEFSIEIPEELYGVLGTVNDFAKQILEMTKDRPDSEKPKKHSSRKKKNG